MRATTREMPDLPIEWVLGALREVPRWAASLGATHVERDGDHWNLAFSPSIPRCMTLRGAVREVEFGIECRITGDVGEAGVRCTAVAGPGSSTSVVLEVEATSDLAVPGTWWTELAAEIVPRWLSSLQGLALDRAGTGPSVG